MSNLEAAIEISGIQHDETACYQRVVLVLHVDMHATTLATLSAVQDAAG